MKHWLLLTIAILIAAFVALAAATVRYVAFTEAGLQFVIAHLPERIGRVRIDIGAASGTLARGLRVDRLEIEHERVLLQFTDVRGRISLAPLLWRTIDVDDVSARTVLIQVRRRVRQPNPGARFRFLPPAMAIRVEHARADALSLIVPSGRRFDATHVASSGVVHSRTIRFFDADFALAPFDISGKGTLRAATPLQLDLDGRLGWRVNGQPSWVVDVSADGDLDVLPFEGHITAPMRADFAGRAQELTRRWHWTADSIVRDFDLRTWGGGGALGQITGTLAISGDASGFKAHGPLTPAGLAAGAFDTSFEGSYSNRVVTADRIEIVHPGAGSRLLGSGTIEVVPQDGPRLQLAGEWKDFRWPLVGESAAVRSSVGHYTITGTRPYALRASGDIAAGDLEAMGVEMTGNLATSHLHIAEARVATFGGRANLHGEIRWSPAYTWSAAGIASGIDPSHVRDDLPGSLGFAFDASGERFDSTADFAVRVSELSGRLRKQPARGGGRLERRGDQWSFDAVRLGFGRTNVALDGQLGERVDLRFDIDANDLGLLAAGTTGHVQARGTIAGPRELPSVELVARGGSIRHGNFRINAVDADIHFDATPTAPSSARVTVNGLALGERTFDRIALVADGTAQSHVATLDVDAQRLELDLHANGTFMGGNWRGVLDRFDARGTESLRLALDLPTMLTASEGTIRVGAFCLSGSPARLCAEGNWSRQRWAAKLSASELPMSTLTSGLSPDIEYRGTINVTAEGHGEGDTPLQGTMSADLTDAQLAHRVASGRLEVITLGSGRILANAMPDAVHAEIGLEAGEIGTIKGTAVAQRMGRDWRAMPLAGHLRMQTAELGFVTLYVPEIDRAAGQLTSELTFSGTLGRPLVNGVVKLSQAEVDLYQINLALRGAELTTRLSDNALEFDGSAHIGDGTVRTRGLLAWRNSLPYGRLELKGEHLRVADIPEARIEASPDLGFDIDGRKIVVTGAVAVPTARIVPADLTGTVRTSSDEIIVGANATDPSSRFDVSSDIDLRLGDQVSIDTSGLTGRLTGNIKIRTAEEDITRGTGELQIEEGRYAAYGRKLDIQRGRLIFTGGPIGNPGVDIRAVKQYPEVVAGVNVRGTLLQPRLTFFSEPSLPQSQIVSLILAGGSLASVEGQGATAGGSRNNELLAQGGAILAQQLGARIGIEDMTIESDLNNETSLVLGKYLSPRLYVSYGISLTEALNTLKLRYSLDDHWTVRTEMSTEQSAELVYTIEK